MFEMESWSVSEKEWRKGPWIPEEDKLLAEYVSQNGEGRWSSVARFAGMCKKTHFSGSFSTLDCCLITYFACLNLYISIYIFRVE